MPGLPLFFTDASGVAELTHRPRPGLYLGEDTFLGEGIWLDQGVAEAFAEQPFLENVGIVYSVTTTPAEATMTMPGLPAIGDVIEVVDTVPAVATMSMPGFGGQDLVYPATTIPAVATMPMPGTSGAMSVILVPSVRELPPLRVHIDVQTPAGKHFRWGSDEPDPANVPAGIRFSDTMPGGFETFDCTLPRKSSRNSPELEPFSTVKVVGAGGQPVWEGRLERAPRSSGEQVAVSPSAVGPQAYLDDDKSARQLYVDIRLDPWVGMSPLRRSDLLNPSPPGPGPWSIFDGQVGQSLADPMLLTTVEGQWPIRAVAEVIHHGVTGEGIGKVYYRFAATPSIVLPDPNWFWSVSLADNDRGSGAVATGNLASGPSGSGYFTHTGSAKRTAILQISYATGPSGTQGLQYELQWSDIAVYGTHGLPTYGPDPGGVLASDVVTHAVRRWAPQLNVTPTSVQPSAFVISHLVFTELTTAAEIIKQTTRFGLQDWAVWDNQTFWCHDRGAYGRKWRTRIAPAQLEETGAAADRVWESIIVSYQDTDGSTKIVGPPGSGADFEDPALKDLDPDNPANQAGITRRDMLQMGTSTAAGAIEIGRRFLEESRQLDHSGRARFVGHVESDRGVLYPYWAPRAGDTVSFIDASDSSARRIVRTEKDHGSRTCSVDLDAPPEGLQALLERLGVVLVPLGL